MKKKNFKRYYTGNVFYGELYPCGVNDEIVTKGYAEVSSIVKEDEQELIVGVWSEENTANDGDRHFSSAEEFLLVDIKYLPNKVSNDPDRPYVFGATVIGRLNKNNVKPLVSDVVTFGTKLLIDY